MRRQRGCDKHDLAAVVDGARLSLSRKWGKGGKGERLSLFSSFLIGGVNVAVSESEGYGGMLPEDSSEEPRA